jgi:hypothetical protein
MSELNLTAFEIGAWRGLRDLKFEGLGRLNVLFGPNNSGKTSVLESVGTFCRPTDAQHWVKARQLRDPGGIDESKLVTLRWFFADLRPVEGQVLNDVEETFYEGHMSLRGGGSHQVRKIDALYREFAVEVSKGRQRRLPWMEDETGAPGSGPLFQRAAKIVVRFWGEMTEGARSIRFYESEPLRSYRRGTGPSVPVVVYNSSAYHAGQQLVRMVHDLQFGPWHEYAVDAMREFDAFVDGLEIGSSSGVRPGIYVRHRRLGVVPLTAFGDGMRRAATLVAGAAAATGGSLLLDEIESGIHHSVLPEVLHVLMRSAEQFNTQVFATTHSLDAIDAIVAASETRHDIVAFRLPPLGSGRPVARFSGPDLYRLRHNSGLEVR